MSDLETLRNELNRLRREHAQTEAELGRRALQQTIMHELSQRVIRNISLATVMNEVVDLIAAGTETTHTFFLRLNSDNNSMVWGSGRGWSSILTEHLLIEVDIDSLLTGEPIIVEDLSVSQRSQWSPLLDNQQIVSGMLIPVVDHNQLFGIVGACSPQQDQFLATDLQFLQIIANTLAAAIRHELVTIDVARLNGQVQREIAEHTHIEAELQRIKADLETQVADCGQALIEINNALQAEIIERERVEEALIQARDQVLAANRLKTDLLANVSHELRTPLSVIIGFAELIDLGVYGPVTEEQRHVLAKLLAQSQRQIELINNLLDQARLEANQIKLLFSRFTPADIVNEIQFRLTEQAQAKGLSLTIEIDADIQVELLGDLARLQQSLINLVDNAIKFTEHGEVGVYFYRVDIDRWGIEVNDTGPGIPAEVQPHIFEPFEQQDSSATRKYGGVGLGLSIVKQLVNLMGGEVTLESQVGRGSTFRMILPFRPPTDTMHESFDA